MPRLRLTLALAVAAAACGDDGAGTLDGGALAGLGAQYVAGRGCASCHGSPDGNLAGQTTPVAGTTSYGSNLTPDVATGLGGWADIEIVRTMRWGFDPDGRVLCPAMPRADGDAPDARHAAMTDLEASAIVAYLRSLAPESRAVPASSCPAPVAADMGAAD